MTIDISNFDLISNLPKDQYEYIFIELVLILEDFIKKYNLKEMEVNGILYLEVVKGMYVLLQSVTVAYKDLVSLLVPRGFYPSDIKPGL